MYSIHGPELCSGNGSWESDYHSTWEFLFAGRGLSSTILSIVRHRAVFSVAVMRVLEWGRCVVSRQLHADSLFFCFASGGLLGKL